MQPSTEISVPAKLILMGEHAVVYHCPAVVAAVNLRLRVSFSDTTATGVRISLPQVRVQQTLGWPSVLAYARSARDRWRQFAERPSQESFVSVRGNDPAHVVKVALGEVAEWCGEGTHGPLSVAVESEIPIGSGFGSSAATSVGVIAGYMAHCRLVLDRQTIDRLAMEVERRQHGLPSGVDHSTVLHGGVLWAKRSPNGSTSTEPLSPASSVLSRIQVYDSGPPIESTGTVVSAVRDRLGGAPERSQEILERMEATTWAFRGQLTRDNEDPAEVVGLIREYEQCLELLGVVPEPVQRMVRQVEAEGGAAKISGAGALTGHGAGGLLIYHPCPEQVATWKFLKPLKQHEVSLGAQGLREEARA